MKPILLTSNGVPPVHIDPIVLADTRMLLCANSGSGKSQVLRLIAEQAGNQLPTIVIDPEGEWATLRSHVHAVLVGPGGDVRADVKFAKKLARRLLDVNCSAIVDISDLKADEKQSFVRLLLEGMLSAPKSLWRARLLMVDEAHKFASESGREGESRQAIIDLMDSGRKRGLGGILATQRLSKLAKDCVAEANNWMAGRCAQDVDLRRISELAGFAGRSEWDMLRNLLPGEFLAMGPAFDHTGVKRFRTNSRTETAHPQAGARHLALPPKPSAQARAFVAKLNELPLSLESEDIPAPRAEVDIELKKSLAFQQRRGDELEAKNQAIDQAVKEMLGSFARLQSLLSGQPSHPTQDIASAPTSVSSIAATGGARRSSRRTDIGDTERAVSGAALKLLVALLQHGKPISRNRAALIAQLSPKSSTFRNAMTSLRSNSPPLMRDEDGQQIAATVEAEAEYAGHYTPLPTGPALVVYWRGRLGGANQRLFDALAAYQGAPVSRETAASRAGLSATSSTFRNAMTKLRGLGLMQDGSQGYLALARDLL